MPANATEQKCAGKRIVVLGDSLVAGYGLNPGEDFPARLNHVLNEAGYGFEVLNAGVSGDTSAGGLSRLDWSIGQEVDGVVVELGANDALRGIPVEITRKNLLSIVEKLKARGVEIVLAGMLAPPNMGDEYGRAFNQLYRDIAAHHEILFYPFFLDGVAANPNLNQADGIHPTAKGVELITKNFTPIALEFAQSLCAR